MAKRDVESTIDAEGRTPREIAPTGPKVGDVLGDRYELVAELGRGAFGLVFRARDRVAHDTVAVKMLALHRRNAEQIERMRRELRAARKIAHPAVVRIHDLIDVGDQIVLSMELVDGETLAARLERVERLDPETWTSLARDLAAGLAAAHAAGVMHRDLKPSNVMLRARDGAAVITDFGVSRIADGAVELAETTPEGGDVVLTHEGALIGTPLYMAPEQLAARPSSPAADLHALGIVLYEAATGERPFTGRNVTQLLEARGTPPTPLAAARPDLPPAACALVHRLLADDPEARPSASDLVTALGRTRSRRRWWPTAIGVGLVVAAAVTTWLAWPRPASAPPPIGSLALEVANTGDRADDALVPAVTAIARRALALDRHVTLADDAPATLSIEFRRTSGGVALDLTARRADRTVELPAVEAASVEEALTLAAPAVAALSASAPPRPPTDAERATMTMLGAGSIEAFDHYQVAVYEFLRAETADRAGVYAAVQEATAIDPRWIHPWILRAVGAGWSTDEAKAVMREARATCDPDRDPRGWALADAIDANVIGEHARAAALAEAVYDVDDLAGAYILIVEQLVLDQIDARIAILRELVDRHPELQFGFDLVLTLTQNGRGVEAAPIVAAWLATAPGNEQALATDAQLAAVRGDFSLAAARASEILLLFGELPARLVLVCDVLINANRLTEAAAIADKLVRGDALAHQRGLHRQGVIAVLDGRFAAAYQSLADAMHPREPLGMFSENFQILQSLQSLAWIGAPGDRARWTTALADQFASFGEVRKEALTRYELALLERAPRAACPTIDDAMEMIPAGALRNAARPAFLRMGPEHGCGRCADVVASGRSFREDSARSLTQFAACAEREGAMDLAAQAYRDIISRTLMMSQGLSIDFAYEWVLAHHHLARVERALGHADEARRLEQAFVDQWARADRVIPELDEARKLLASP